MPEERFVQVVAKKIHSILSTPRSMFHLTIRSHFDCDENSVPFIQNFLLLDFIAQEAWSNEDLPYIYDLPYVQNVFFFNLDLE